MAAAQQLISTLKARGWNNSQIAQTFGRDPSLIRQAALGKKPVNNLVPGLERLVQTGKGPSARLTEAVQAERRVGKTGELAQVRKPLLPVIPKVGEKKVLPSGQVYERAQSTFQAKDYLAHLPGSKHVTISFKDKQGNYHTIGKKGGYRVDYLQRKLASGKSWHAIVQEIASGVYGEDTDVVGAVELIAA